jgi:tetratricopeptide (TPR) repeat protein
VPTVIDFGEGVAPARRPFPLPSASPTRTSSGAGQGRSLNQRIRGLSSDVDLARVRETTSATPRSRGQLSHSDVLARYRASATAAAAPRGASPSAGSNDSSAARISAARRQAAAESAAAESAAARTEAARQKQATQNAARTQAARADAADRSDRATEQRVREAREKAASTASSDDATRARIEAARRDKAASNEARTQAARRQYDERVRAARESSTQTGGGLVVGGSAPIAANGVAWGSGSGDCYSGGYYNNCYWNTWGSCWSLGWCSWWCAPSYCCGLWWHSYWWGGGSWCYPWNFYWYGPFIPSSYTVVYQEPEPEVIYVEVPAAQEGEVVVPAAAPAFVAPTQPDAALERELNRATGYYLTQGDRAFREGRYGDAAHFYAKAVEFSPDSGILYLVLADALFATGDYRYAAFAIRKALELEPELASNVIDKRDFYAVSADFDRQLATLERFVDDHVIDDDARLVLAANYLFGGRPAAAVDLFASPFSENLAKSSAGQLIFEAAKLVQFGRPEAAPAAEGPVPPAAVAPAAPAARD